MGTLEVKECPRFIYTEWDLPDAGVYLQDKDLAVPIDKMEITKLIANVQDPYMSIYISGKVDATIYKLVR